MGIKTIEPICRYTPLNKSGNFVVAADRAFIYAVLKGFQREMLEEGLEPTLLAEPDPKSGASANFATRAFLWMRKSG